MNADLVNLCGGRPPAFWKDGAILPGDGGIGELSDEQVKRMVYVPLNEGQASEWRRSGYLAIPLKIKDLGELFYEVFVNQGEQIEIVYHSTSEPDAGLLEGGFVVGK